MSKPERPNNGDWVEDFPELESGTTQRLGWYLLLSLALFLTLASIQGKVLFSQIQQEAGAAHLLGIAERQRTLLAQLRLDAEALSRNQEAMAKPGRAGFGTALDEFLNNHITLFQGDGKTQINVSAAEAIAGIMSERPFELNRHLREFTLALRDLQASDSAAERQGNYGRAIAIADDHLLAYSLGTLVAILRGEHTARVRALRTGLGSWLVSLGGAVILAGLLVVEPAVRRVRGEALRLQRANEYMRSALSEARSSRALLERQQLASLSVLEDLEVERAHLADEVRVRQLTEAQLKEANLELETRNTEVQQLVYTVSHDLKAPIVTIVGFLAALEEDLRIGNNKRVEESIKHLKRAADRLSRIISDLLELSRIGRVDNKPERVDVGALVRELADSLHPQLEGTGTRIEVQADLPEVFIDRSRLAEVFENLLTNAVKYAATGAGPIEVGCERVAGVLQFHVRDHGPGIPREYRDKVFGLFQRLVTDSQGTGVGLAIVKRVVELNGGRVWIGDEDDAGATFYFTVPFSDDASNASVRS